MVQVDIFWSYGIGAGLAVAAHRQIMKTRNYRINPEAEKPPHSTPEGGAANANISSEGGAANPNIPSTQSNHRSTPEGGAANPNIPSTQSNHRSTPEGGAANPNIRSTQSNHRSTPEGGAANPNIPSTQSNHRSTPEGGAANPNIPSTQSNHRSTPEGGAANANISSEGGIWQTAFNSPYFTKVLLFLGLIFVPSGFWLLWQFSSWETMHAGTRDLPVWLVGLFAITNVSQGVLGFVICHHLIRSGKLYAAWLNFIGAYFGMFFILVHGWDGKGYQRFFSPDRASFENWSWATAGEWFTSDVAFTLYGMAVIFLPALGGMTLSWIQKGANDIGLRSNPLTTLSGFLGSVLVFALGLAIICSVAIMQLGLIPGIIASIVIILGLTHKRWGLGPWFYRTMTLESRLSA